jgi:hypothetical protein
LEVCADHSVAAAAAAVDDDAKQRLHLQQEILLLALVLAAHSCIEWLQHHSMREKYCSGGYQWLPLASAPTLELLLSLQKGESSILSCMWSASQHAGVKCTKVVDPQKALSSSTAMRSLRQVRQSALMQWDETGVEVLDPFKRAPGKVGHD